jgi:hypothetical protein
LLKLISSLSLFLLLCVLTLPVAAFTPDDAELSSLLKRNYGGLTSWEAVMSFPGSPGVSAHVWYARGRWRQEWKAGDTARAVGVNDSIVAACTEGGFALSPLFVWMPSDPVSTWKSWGVDNATRGYGFCDESPCFMLGAESGDGTSPAVFLNNEDMSPLMFRYATRDGLMTIRFSAYRTHGGFQLPERVAVDMAGQIVEASVKWIAVNRADSEELYARDAFDATPCAVPPSPFDVLRDIFRYPVAK